MTGCDGGCRVIALELTARRATATVELYRLSQGGRDLVSGEAFADVTRWRPPAGAGTVGGLLVAGDGRLEMSKYTAELPPGNAVDTRVFVADSPVPLPVVLAGDRPKQRRPGEERLTVMGTEASVPDRGDSVGAAAPGRGVGDGDWSLPARHRGDRGRQPRGVAHGGPRRARGVGPRLQERGGGC